MTRSATAAKTMANMNTRLSVRRRTRAFTLMELFAVILVVMVLLIFFLPDFGRHDVAISNCSSNLKALGAAFRSWANDHDGKLPMQLSTNDGGSMELAANGNVFLHLRILGKELQTPKVLVCPADIDRQVITNFTTLDNSHVSYFVGVDAAVTNWNSASTNGGMFLAGDRNLALNGHSVKSELLVVTAGNALSWAKKIHNRHGNILFEDGRVDFMNTAELKRALQQTGTATNRLAIP